MRALFAATTILLAASAACSSTSGAPTGAASSDGGPDSTAPSGDDTANDGGAVDSAPSSGDDANQTTGDDAANDSSDAGGDSAPNPFMGAVFAISDSTHAADGGALLDYSVGAYFAHQTSPDQSIVSTTTVGPCVVQVLGSGSAPVETDESAGTVQLTGGAKTIKLTPANDATYTTTQSSTASLWTGGETLTLSADGGPDGAVPAFSTTVVAPSKITITSPALPSSSGSMNVPRNAPWIGTWSGASSGSVVIYFDVTDGANAYTATCKFDASAGTGTVPAAAFASFPAGSGSFNFYVETSAAPVVPGWSIHFNASSAVVDATGAGAMGNTTYP